MSDKKVSQLLNSDPLTGSEILPIVQLGQNRKTTVQDIADLNSGIGTPARYAQVIYVDQHGGNNTTGDGSLSKPYLTISRAMQDVPTSGLSLTNSYAIQLGAGAYTETSLAMKPFVHICGMGYLASRINVTTNQITLDTSSGMFTSSSRIGFYNLSLSGSTGFNFDLSALSSSSLVVDGRGCWVNGSSTFIGRDFGADYLELYGFFFFSNFTATRFQGELDTSVVVGTLTLNCQGYSIFADANFELSASRFSGPIVINSDNSRSQKLGMTASSITSVNASGANIEITGDAISLPDYTNIALSGGAAIKKSQPFPRKVAVPLTSTSSGLEGDFALDSSYRYDCISQDVWVRTAVISSF